jgi:hypothetical protein
MDIWIVSAILIVALYSLITEKITVDLTAIGIIVALVVSRVHCSAGGQSGVDSP